MRININCSNSVIVGNLFSRLHELNRKKKRLRFVDDYKGKQSKADFIEKGFLIEKEYTETRYRETVRIGFLNLNIIT